MGGDVEEVVVGDGVVVVEVVVEVEDLLGEVVVVVGGFVFFLVLGLLVEDCLGEGEVLGLVGVRVGEFEFGGCYGCYGLEVLVVVV